MAKVTQDRTEQVFVHEAYKLFITTGQWEGDPAATLGARRRSGLLVQPFNTLDAAQIADLREKAAPFGAKSYITLSATAQQGALTFTDDLTQGTTAIPFSALDRDVQAKLAKPGLQSHPALPLTFSRPTLASREAPNQAPRRGLKRTFATAVLGIAGFCGLGYTAYNHLNTSADAAASAGSSLSQDWNALSGVVSSQTVRTLFVDKNYTAGEPVTWMREDDRVPTRVVAGRFRADDAYRYDIVFDHSNTRNGNTVASFTSDRDILAGLGAYDAININIPADARVTALADLPAADRNELRRQYEDFEKGPSAWAGAGGQRQSLPTGLADAAAYLKPGVDGYSFQDWNDISNGIGPNLYFRDVTGMFGNGAVLPGKKTLTELTIREEGKYCVVNGAPDEYDHQPDTKGPNCKSFDKMTPAEFAGVKQRAAAVDLALVDETLHTYVRDAQGKIVAEDTTQTLTHPAHLVTRLLKQGTDQRDIEGPLDTYVFMELNPAGNRVARVIEATFAKGTFAPGVVPPVKATGGHEFGEGSYDGTKGRPEYDVAGEKVWADTDPTGYSIRYASGRFTEHGKNSRLPKNQRNEFGG